MNSPFSSISASTLGTRAGAADDPRAPRCRPDTLRRGRPGHKAAAPGRPGTGGLPVTSGPFTINPVAPRARGSGPSAPSKAPRGGALGRFALIHAALAVALAGADDGTPGRSGPTRHQKPTQIQVEG